MQYLERNSILYITDEETGAAKDTVTCMMSSDSEKAASGPITSSSASI